MKGTRILAILLAVAAVGCTSTRMVTLDLRDPFSQLNEVAAQKEGVVVLANGVEMGARALRAERDSISWIDPETKALVQVAVTEVAAVQFVHRGKGTLQGLGLGAGIGVGVGALAGLATCEDVSDLWSAGECRTLSTVFSGVVGGLLGSLTGTLRGRRKAFRFPTSSDVKMPTDEQNEVASR